MPKGGPFRGRRDLSSFRCGIVAVALLIGVLIVATSVFVVLMLREQTMEDSSRRLRTASSISAERTFQMFSAADIFTRSIQDVLLHPTDLAGFSFKERVGSEMFHLVLKSRQALLPQISAVAVADETGQLIAYSNFFPAPAINLSGDSFFMALRQPNHGLVISAPLRKRSGVWSINVARGLFDSDGKFTGVIYVGIDVDYLETYLSKIDVGRTHSATLFNGDLQLMARSPSLPGLIGMRLQGPGLQGPDLADGETQVRFLDGSDGVRRLIALTRFNVQNEPLYLSVSQTSAAVLAPWWSAVSLISLFAVSSLIGLALLAWFMIRAVRDEERWSNALLDRETRLSRQSAELAAARDAAERANQVRGQFLANMSHELRTPLNAVLGFSQILSEELFGPLGDPRYREFVLDIQNSGRHLLDVIGNILDLTKIDSGKLALAEHPVDLADVMRGSARLLGDAARAAKVHVEVKLPDPDIALRADPVRLRQILINLLSNAVKFTPEGKEIVLSAILSDDAIEISVADQGIGMSPEEIDQALEPFRQVDNSFARRYEGTGLGLPLTKSLVELHGGTLAVASTPGVGTTVTVRLPRARLRLPGEA